MGMGWDNSGDYWEPSSMLEHDPGEEDIFAESGSFGYKRGNKDGWSEAIYRTKQWLEHLTSGEIKHGSLAFYNMDTRTLEWLAENIDNIYLEFPPEIKARQAKEAAAILKEAEQLETRAKQLREKAAQTK